MSTNWISNIIYCLIQESMIIKLKNHLKKLGYDNLLTFETGKEAIKDSITGLLIDPYSPKDIGSKIIELLEL